MRIIFPALSYETLSSAELVPLVVRRRQLTDKLFLQIISDTSHKLNDLLPPANKCQVNFKRKLSFQSQIFRTDRFKKSFIVYNVLKTHAWI